MNENDPHRIPFNLFRNKFLASLFDSDVWVERASGKWNSKLSRIHNFTFQISAHTEVGTQHSITWPQPFEIVVDAYFRFESLCTLLCIHRNSSKEFLHFLSYTHTESERERGTHFDSNFASSSKNKRNQVQTEKRKSDQKRCMKPIFLFSIFFWNVKILQSHDNSGSNAT